MVTAGMWSVVALRLLNGRTTVKQNDFDYGILDELNHRPWPLPDWPWVMTQTWHDLLFAHWPVDTRQLGAQIPAALELDLHEGAAWIGIVPFHMTNVAPRGIPALPWVSAFPEINVRTYVRVGHKRGVYLFSLDAGNPLAVGVARTLFHLPYYFASMNVVTDEGTIRYRSRRSGTGSPEARFIAAYRPVGGIFRAQRDSLEYFLTERYCLYTVDTSGQPRRLDIHHRPWTLQSATVTFQSNTMTDAVGIALPALPPLLHFAKRQDVVAWLPTVPEGR
jgi:uncharacterized protein